MAETEVIPLEMEATRQELAVKLESLERKVTNTVESVADTIQATVESVTDKVQQTVETVTGTVEAVTDTVNSTKDSVENTVASVKEGMEETVQSVKDGFVSAFDVSEHVRQHPWPMLGGSVAVGFLLGSLLGGKSSARHRPEYNRDDEPYNRSNGNGASKSRNAYPEAKPDFLKANGYGVPQAAAPKPGWIDWIANSFGGEIDAIKSLAVGTAVGVIRDVITQSLPDSLKKEVTKVMNDFTSNLGGKTIAEPILGEPEESLSARRY